MVFCENGEAVGTDFIGGVAIASCIVSVWYFSVLQSRLFIPCDAVGAYNDGHDVQLGLFASEERAGHRVGDQCRWDVLVNKFEGSEP